MSIDPETVERLSKLIDCVFDHYDEFKDECYVVKDSDKIKSNPILFFGNLYDYLESETKIITVGLNPSKVEFEVDRFNFPSNSRVNQEGYIKSLCNYFTFKPYRGWFSAYNKFVRFFDASFYPGKTNTALHTDLLTPIATDPTWSKLKLPKAKKDKIIKSGFPIWSKLMDILEPKIIICSIGVEQRVKNKYTFGPNSMEAIGRGFPYGDEGEKHYVSRIKSDKHNIFHLISLNTPLAMKHEQFFDLADLIKSEVRQSDMTKPC